MAERHEVCLVEVVEVEPSCVEWVKAQVRHVVVVVVVVDCFAVRTLE